MADADTTIEFVDETLEGRSIVFWQKQSMGARRDLSSQEAQFIPFSAQTRMSGVDIGGRPIRKGAPDALSLFVSSQGGVEPAET